MIAKRVEGRVDGRFRKLARYLMSEQGRPDRVIAAWATNAGFDDIRLALGVIDADQTLGNPGRIDPTYHLIVSFRAGEKADLSTIRQIEARFAKALGYEEHHRLTVVHGDTENLHFHIAFSKVHPETLKRHTPWRDFYTLDRTCAEVEQAFGLERDNRISERAPGEEARPPQKARDMEAHGGLESFARFVQGEPRAALAAVLAREEASWRDVHAALARFDLVIRPRGAGLIIADREGRQALRASDVLRAASKRKLEARLGPLQEADQEIAPETRYERRPPSPEGRALYERYTAERAATTAARETDLSKIREKALQERSAARRDHRAERAKIWLDPLLTKAAKARLTGNLEQMRRRMSASDTRMRQRERSYVFRIHKTKVWRDWLRHEAERGGEQALRALRRAKPQERAAPPLSPAPRMSAELWREALFARGLRLESVTKHGAAIWAERGSGGWGSRKSEDHERLIEDQQGLRLDPKAEAETIARALALAAERAEGPLKIEGPAEFRRACAEIAGRERLKIAFADEALEAARAAAAPPATSGVEREEEERPLGSLTTDPPIWISPNASPAKQDKGRGEEMDR